MSRRGHLDWPSYAIVAAIVVPVVAMCAKVAFG